MVEAYSHSWPQWALNESSKASSQDLILKKILSKCDVKTIKTDPLFLSPLLKKQNWRKMYLDSQYLFFYYF